MPVKFTVGIPTHNRRETVLLATASALEQTRPPDEICVIADGCTDGTQEAVRDLGDPRVRVLDLPKAPGVGYAHRDEVLARAGDGVVAWLADDDLWLPDHLERVGEIFDAGATEIVNSMACLVHPDGGLEPFGVHWRAPTYRDLFLAGENRTPSSAVSHLASLGLAVGGWPKGIGRAGDLDLWQRMIRGGARSEMVLAPTVLFFRAAEREQDWAERVAQNSGFLARIRDPGRLAGLRAEIAFACASTADANLAALLAGQREAVTRDQERRSLMTELSAITSGRDALAAQVDSLTSRHEALALRCDSLTIERDAHAAELTAIRSTRWWRLRRFIDPVMRRTHRWRGHPKRR